MIRLTFFNRRFFCVSSFFLFLLLIFDVGAVTYTNSSNFSVQLNAPSSLSYVPAWYPIYSVNVTGIPEKNVNSSDIRIVETATGNSVCFDVLSNTSNSAEIVLLINFTSYNDNHTMVMYWGASNVGTYDNSCPNQLNWQVAATKMIAPDIKAGWTFTKAGMTGKPINFSGGSSTAGIFNDAFDDGSEYLVAANGASALVFNGNAVKIVNSSYSGRSALIAFFPWSNFTRITYHGFTKTANDGYYATFGNPAGANTLYFRNVGGNFGSVTNVLFSVNSQYGMIACKTNADAWAQYVYMNVSQLLAYASGLSIDSATRSGDPSDPQMYFPSSGWGAANLKVWLGNFTVWTGATTVTQDDLNATYALRNATWITSFSSQVAAGGSPTVLPKVSWAENNKVNNSFVTQPFLLLNFSFVSAINDTFYIINSSSSVAATANLTPIAGAGYFYLNLTLPDGKYSFLGWVNDTSGNTNMTLNRTFIIDTTPPTCNVTSRMPTDINDSSSGLFYVLINCTDPNGINVSFANNHYRAFTTRTVEGFIVDGLPNRWSTRYPSNNLSSVDVANPSYGNILRALGRSEGFWFDTLGYNTTLNNDTFSYAVNDGWYGRVNVTNTSLVSATINYTGIVDMVFRQNIPISYEALVNEPKKNFEFTESAIALSKMFDWEAVRNSQNYTTHAFININNSGNTARNVIIRYCNNTYNPAGAVTMPTSPNCALLTTLTLAQVQTHQFADRNSSYYKISYGALNSTIGGIRATPYYYLAFEASGNIGLAANRYNVRYVNQSAGANINVSFNNTKLAWTSANSGASWTQANWTYDIFTTSTKNTNDEFQFGVYAEDKAGNAYLNLSIILDDISATNHPISVPIILQYNSTAMQNDANRNGTHRGIMQVKVGTAKDPDSVGNVTHNLTLRNTDGSWNYTINTSFKSPDDSAMWISFNSSAVPDGTYKMNIWAVAGDNVADVENTTTADNFTLDNYNFPKITNFNSDVNGTSYHKNFIFVNYTINFTGGNFSVAYSFNGTLSNITYNASLQIIQHNYTGMKDGDYNFSIIATAYTGNMISTGIVFIRLDTTPPIIVLANPRINNSFQRVQQNNIVFNASCWDTNLYECSIGIYFINGTLFYANQSTNIDGNLSYNVTVSLISGQYIFRANASDDLTFSPPIPDLKESIEGTTVKMEDKVAGIAWTVTPAVSSKSEGPKEDKDVGLQAKVTELKNKKHTDYLYDFRGVKNPEDYVITLRIQSEQEIVYRTPISYIPAHFVIGNRYYWNAKDVVDAGFIVSVEKQDEHLYTVTIKEGRSKWASTTSIDPVSGGLNIVNAAYNFNADGIKPTFVNNQTNVSTPSVGASVGLSINVSDDYNLSNVTLESSFFSGLSHLTNRTIKVSGSVQNVTFNVTMPAAYGSLMSYKFYVADWANNVNSTLTYYLIGCVETWECSGWVLNNTDGIEYRNCVDTSGCGSVLIKPAVNQNPVTAKIFQIFVILLALALLFLTLGVVFEQVSLGAMSGVLFLASAAMVLMFNPLSLPVWGVGAAGVCFLMLGVFVIYQAMSGGD